jgi:hypothetical protein
MFKIISHRGNLSGRTPDENKPTYIEKAIIEGFDVEIDIWSMDNKLFLGHDEPQYEIDITFLSNDKLWCHAKNKQAFEILLKNNIHVFWHENDKYTITSRGIPWCYPNNYINNGITVEYSTKKDIPDILGICTNYPLTWI